MSIPEYASPSATAKFAQRQDSAVQQHGFARLGRTNLQSSRLGFGTYRCHSDIQQHKEAIRLALQSGCNLFDTSANYTDGNAEVLIGDLLNEEVVWGERAREELIIVSKAGYIQGENMEIALAREEKSEPFPEVVRYQSGLWHCIHPEFLEDQITRSLARMHLDTLDIYLLHNPEYFLSHAMQQGLDSQTVSKQFYDRIRKAFVQLESMVNEGLIRWYGISSNGFPLPEGSVNAVSLDLVWRAYQDACLQNGLTPEQGHFAIIQMPFNWIESGAIMHKSAEKQQTVLQTARALDLAVLANRPLNAIENNQLVRLSSRALNERTKQLQANFDRANPALADLTMSQKALAVCKSVEGIDVVLNGMRTPDYVKDSMGIADKADANLSGVI